MVAHVGRVSDECRRAGRHRQLELAVVAGMQLGALVEAQHSQIRPSDQSSERIDLDRHEACIEHPPADGTEEPARSRPGVNDSRRPLVVRQPFRHGLDDCSRCIRRPLPTTPLRRPQRRERCTQRVITRPDRSPQTPQGVRFRRRRGSLDEPSLGRAQICEEATASQCPRRITQGALIADVSDSQLGRVGGRCGCRRRCHVSKCSHRTPPRVVSSRSAQCAQIARGV